MVTPEKFKKMSDGERDVTMKAVNMVLDMMIESEPDGVVKNELIISKMSGEICTEIMECFHPFATLPPTDENENITKEAVDYLCCMKLGLETFIQSHHGLENE